MELGEGRDGRAEPVEWAVWSRRIGRAGHARLPMAPCRFRQGQTSRSDDRVANHTEITPRPHSPVPPAHSRCQPACPAMHPPIVSFLPCFAAYRHRTLYGPPVAVSPPWPGLPPWPPYYSTRSILLTRSWTADESRPAHMQSAVSARLASHFYTHQSRLRQQVSAGRSFFPLTSSSRLDSPVYNAPPASTPSHSRARPSPH